MRKVLFALGLAAALIALPSPALADEGAIVNQFTVGGTLTGCDGDIITYSGTIMRVVRPSPETGTTLLAQYMTVNMTGTSSSGATYHITGVYLHIATPADAGGQTYTGLLSSNLISTGAGDNRLFLATTHLTVNANGDVVVDSNELRMVCAG